MSSFPLSDELLTAAGPEARLAASAELESLLVRHLDAAQSAWPDVQLASSQMLSHLARHLPDDLDRLARVHFSDLFLACAVLHSDPAALAHFDRNFLARVPSYVRKLDKSAAFGDDVRQLLSEKLLVSAGSAPKLADYSGAGSLEGFVRVAAIRVGQNLLRGPKSGVPLSDNDALALHDRAPSPELEYLRARYAHEFSGVLREVLLEQNAKDKNLLTLYFVDGLPSAAIGKLYGVHGATVRRWIEQARQTLLVETRQRLRQRLKLEASEFESLMILVQSKLDLTITHLMRQAPTRTSPT